MGSCDCCPLESVDSMQFVCLFVCLFVSINDKL